VLAIPSGVVRDGEDGTRPKTSQIRRRDRHGRGLRGALVPPGVPLHRTRSQRFDDLVLLAVSQLEPRWEAELAEVEFAIEEIPPILPEFGDPDPVPLARLEPGSAPSGIPDLPGPVSLPGQRGSPGRRDRLSQPARIVLYRRPLLARADGEEELAELVLDVIVEHFAHWLGVDPQTVDPGYPAEE
jgi:predicted Zn-dependent protease with MMP-like domain